MDFGFVGDGGHKPSETLRRCRGCWISHFALAARCMVLRCWALLPCDTADAAAFAAATISSLAPLRSSCSDVPICAAAVAAFAAAIAAGIMGVLAAAAFPKDWISILIFVRRSTCSTVPTSEMACLKLSKSSAETPICCCGCVGGETEPAEAVVAPPVATSCNGGCDCAGGSTGTAILASFAG